MMNPTRNINNIKSKIRKLHPELRPLTTNLFYHKRDYFPLDCRMQPNLKGQVCTN